MLLAAQLDYMWLISPVLAFLAFACLVGFACTWLGLRHARYRRQLQHEERLRAIDAGFALDDGQPQKNEIRYQHNAFWISFWIGGAVPIAAVISAGQAVAGVDNLAAILSISIGAACIGLGGVISATVLMTNAGRRQSAWQVANEQYPPPRLDKAPA